MSFNRSALIYVGNMVHSDPALASFALEFMKNVMSALPQGRPVALTWISPGRTYLHFECQCDLDFWRLSIRSSVPDSIIWSFSQVSQDPSTSIRLSADQRRKAVTIGKYLLRSAAASLGIGLSSDVRIRINEQSVFSVEAGIFFVAPAPSVPFFRDPFVPLQRPYRAWDQNPPWAHTWTSNTAEDTRLMEDDRLIRELRASLSLTHPLTHLSPIGPAGENEQG